MGYEDTIAAIATGLPGAIGIVRLSGPGAIAALGALFTPLGGGTLGDHPPRTLVYGDLRDGTGAAIDRVLATYCPGPHTYTGEDTAEVHCHGSPIGLSLALEALFQQGCRQAGPGEFTRRAFLSGKLDLSQAEAVVDLIDATSREGARHAAGQLAGALSRRVGEIYSALVDLMAHFCAALDYPEEDIDPFTTQTVACTLAQQRQAMEALLATWQRGRLVREGVPTAIVGRPNAGKSSLLNALLGYDRAIVTPIPGTTRDTLEEVCQLGGLSLRLIDTAGLRHSDDPVEQLGVQRSRQAMERAQLILVLWDAHRPRGQEDTALLEQAQTLAPTILVWSKCDLPPHPNPGPPLPEGIPVVEVSAQTGSGLQALEGAVAALFPQAPAPVYGTLLTNLRQAQAVQRALECLDRAEGALADGFTPDAVLTDVEGALAALGELTGQSLAEDITARIFQRFCVGK